MSNLFARAATLLLGERPERAEADTQSDAGALWLLRELDYAVEDGAEPGAATAPYR